MKANGSCPLALIPIILNKRGKESRGRPGKTRMLHQQWILDYLYNHSHLLQWCSPLHHCTCIGLECRRPTYRGKHFFGNLCQHKQKLIPFFTIERGEGWGSSSVVAYLCERPWVQSPAHTYTRVCKRACVHIHPPHMRAHLWNVLTFLVRIMNMGDLNSGSVPTCATQLITLISTFIDTVAHFLLRNVFPVHTLEGLIGWRICKAGILFVTFIYGFVV